jgi:hypothetical protein
MPTTCNTRFAMSIPSTLIAGFIGLASCGDMGASDSEIMVAHRSRSAQGRVHFITTRLRKSLEYYSHVQYIFGTCTSGQADCHSVPGGMHSRRAKT